MADSRTEKRVKKYFDEQFGDMRKRGALTEEISPKKYQRLVRQITRMVEVSGKA
jgi:hypothetical protein